MHSDSGDRLRFHERCGTLVKLSPNNRSAKRLRAFDEFNNGVVMTNRNVFDDELFEVKIFLFMFIHVAFVKLVMDRCPFLIDSYR